MGAWSARVQTVASGGFQDTTGPGVAAGVADGVFINMAAPY
jgi:hypothetical protein